MNYGLFNNEQLRSSPKRSRSKILGYTLIIVTLIVVVIFYLYPKFSEYRQSSMIQESSPKEAELRVLNHSIGNGEDLNGIFSKMQVSQEQTISLIDSFGKYWDLRKCHIGDKLEFTFDADNDLVKFQYQASKADIFQVLLMNGQYKVFKRGVKDEVKNVRLQVELKHSLYQDFTEAGETPDLVEKIVDVLAWDIDFFVDSREGDQVSVLVQKHFVDGSFYRYGQILALEYNGKVVNQSAYYFDGGVEAKGYFDETGRSLARNFLKTPVKFTRISSGFGMRRHPVTHMLKHHKGTDYAAPTGTPVWAMADGTIIKKGFGALNGNFVTIKHRQNYVTSYLHLSRFEQGIAVGSRVRQKEIIGFVGSTGRSTGPHLHLSVEYKGNFVDPLKLVKVKDIVLAGGDLERFKPRLAYLLASLRGDKDMIRFSWLQRLSLVRVN